MANSQIPCVQAVYTPQRLSRYQHNPLVEALPASPSDEALIQLLSQLPDFTPEQREWPTPERLSLVTGLTNFCIPLTRHIQLALRLDSMIREGYVGRAPRTAEHIRIFQKIYENQKAKSTFSSATSVTAASLSASLIGLSGMGKTMTLKRLQAHIPEVIYHPEHQIWQIPFLHIETPHDGASVKGLAHSILRKVDRYIPSANYYDLYANKTRASVETLLNNVARVLHIHCVGLLVCDEIQNLENAPKNKQSLMTLLVSASNELGVPILFVGTNKARRVLSLDFRQARRSVGQGLAYWDRLTKGTPSEPGEWDEFLHVLWQFQWVRDPVPVNPMLSDLMYHHSQGIIDVVIKLFAACQWRAMLDGSEKITAQLIDDVAKKELALLQPMVAALRNDDLAALESYDDIAPIDLENLLHSVQAKLSGKRILGASVRPGNPLFAPTVSRALTTLGIGAEQADQIATEVEAQDSSINVLDATKAAIDQLAPPKRVTSKGTKAKLPLPDLLPGDLRHAQRNSEAEGTTIFAQLQKMGAVCDLRQVLLLH